MCSVEQMYFYVEQPNFIPFSIIMNQICISYHSRNKFGLRMVNAKLFITCFASDFFSVNLKKKGIN